jgi:hypothetical protein
MICLDIRWLMDNESSTITDIFKIDWRHFAGKLHCRDFLVKHKNVYFTWCSIPLAIRLGLPALFHSIQQNCFSNFFVIVVNSRKFAFFKRDFLVIILWYLFKQGGPIE